MLRDLHCDQEGVKTIFYDNTSTIAFSKNSLFQKRTNHIDAKYHFIKELIKDDEIVLQHCRSHNSLLIFSQCHWHVNVFFFFILDTI